LILNIFSKICKILKIKAWIVWCKHITIRPYLLLKLGASNIVARSTFEGNPKPLAKETYAGAVDTVGGVALTNVLTMVRLISNKIAKKKIKHSCQSYGAGKNIRFLKND